MAPLNTPLSRRLCLENSGSFPYADDLVLIAKRRITTGKVEKMKDLRIYASKTKVMCNQVNKGQVDDSGEVFEEAELVAIQSCA